MAGAYGVSGKDKEVRKVSKVRLCDLQSAFTYILSLDTHNNLMS